MSKRSLEPLLVVFFLLIVAGLTFLGVRQIEQETRRATGAALQTVLYAVNEALDLWARDRIHDARLLASRPEIAAITRQLLARPHNPEALLEAAALQQSRDLVQDLMSANQYPGFFIVAPDFTNLASMRDQNVGTHNLIAAQRADLMARVFAGETRIVPAIVSDVPLDATKASAGMPPTMFVATPIQRADGAIIAAFAIRLDPINDFSRITGLGRIGESGETYAFSQDGTLMSESRFNEHLRRIGLLGIGQRSVLSIRIANPGGNIMAGHVPEAPPANRALTLMAQSATTGRPGQNTMGYRDYRGIMVFGAWLWNPDLELGLTTEIDAAEALKPYLFARNVVVTSVSVTASVALFLAFYLIRVRSRTVTDLQAARSVLESRVKERTRELSLANDHLQQQITERIRSEQQLILVQKTLEDTNQQLEDMATRDGLTGIANRRAFDEHLSSEWKRCRRNADPIALLLIDIDYFKDYNDNYGHVAGDECLRTVAGLLNDGGYARRPGDLLARYGGEEFTIVLSGSGDDVATDLARQIRQDVEDAAIPHSATRVQGMTTLTISVGVASLIPQPGDITDELLRSADTALYAAKNMGRNRVLSRRQIRPTAVDAARPP